MSLRGNIMTSSATGTSEAARPPYPGLAPFSTAYAAYFFGRETETSILMANMFASRFTVVYGPSGVGKSSLLNAGLLPLVAGQNDVLAVAFRQWAGDPRLQLLRAVRKRTRKLGVPWTELAVDDLEGGCRQATEASARYLMLVLDQFEDYFMYNEPNAPFELELASMLADESLPLRVMVSIREDSIAKLDRFEGLIRNLLDNVLRIEHLTRQGGTEAILRPLEQYRKDTGKEVTAEPELVDAVLDGVRPGRIVLSPGGGGVQEWRTPGRDRIEAAYLQLVMERLWSVESKNDSPTLRAQTLTELGGVKRAVRSRFVELMDSLSLAQQELAAKLFFYLVTPSKTKIAWSPNDLAFYAKVDLAETESLLARLTDPGYRVLRTVETVTESGTELVYEVYHDILARAIVEWQDLYEKRKASLPDAQSQRLHELRERLAAMEQQSLVASDDERVRLVYPLSVLSQEVQPLDPGLAQRARTLAARLSESSTANKSSRSASHIELRQISLLQEQVALAARSGVPHADLADLFGSRLEPFLLSYDSDVRREAAILWYQLNQGETPPPAESATDLSVPAAPVDPSRSGSQHSAPYLGSVSYVGDGVYGSPYAPESFSRSRPIFLRWEFYAFLVIVPVLNVLPLLAADWAMLRYFDSYAEVSRTLIHTAIVISAILWTTIHLYAAIDNRLIGTDVVLVPFAPWSDAVAWYEYLAAWPLHQLLPWVIGLLTVSGGVGIGLPAGWVFFPFVSAATLALLQLYGNAETLVWNSLRVREALGLGARSWQAR